MNDEQAFVADKKLDRVSQTSAEAKGSLVLLLGLVWFSSLSLRLQVQPWTPLQRTGD